MTENANQTALLEGIKRLEEGAVAEAAGLFARVLADDAQNVDALYLLGVAKLRQGAVGDAATLLVQAVAIKPDHIDALLHLSQALKMIGQDAMAAECLGRVAALQPDNVAVRYNLGNLLMGQGQVEAASEQYRAVVAAEPGHVPALTNLGVALSISGKPDEAILAYEQALAAGPPTVDTLRNLGHALLEKGRHAEAVARYREARALDPDRIELIRPLADGLALVGGADDESASLYTEWLQHHADDARAQGALGRVLHRLGRSEEAEPLLVQALAVTPDEPELLRTLGHALSRQLRFEEAESVYRRAVDLRPEDGLTRYNLGVTLAELGRYDEAALEFSAAIESLPDFSPARANLGTALRELGEVEAALDEFEMAVLFDPTDPVPVWNAALANLALGRFEEGWSALESRWDLPRYEKHRRSFAAPLWSGEALEDKTILVHAEQGFGDTIQMARYVPLLEAQGANVVLEVQPALKRLMTSLDAEPEIVLAGSVLPTIDFHVPTLSLPGAFGTMLDTIPAPTAYLHADAALVEAWYIRLANLPAPRVGLVWAGNPSHQSDRLRSIPLADLAALTSDGNLSWVSLQREVPVRDRAALAASSHILDIGQGLADFSETAAAIESLDLVVTVDTAVAHLAGALGKPVFVMLPFLADWRWLLDRQDSPWYPTMRLFRQQTRADWAPVIAEVTAALKAWL